MIKTIVEILKAARDLIADEKNWTQGALASDVSRHQIGVFDDRAVCFCSVGAIVRAAGFGNYADFHNARDYVARKCLGGIRISIFNDNHTHVEVLDLFDRAIAHAESEAA